MQSISLVGVGSQDLAVDLLGNLQLPRLVMLRGDR
jgi:hypothetical protein